MNDNQQNGRNDLSDMLTKNRERRMSEQSVDDILNSLEKDISKSEASKPSPVTASAAKKTEDDVKPYNPAAEIAFSANDNEEATRMVQVAEKKQSVDSSVSQKKTASVKQAVSDDAAAARRKRIQQKKRKEERIKQQKAKQTRKTAVQIFLGVFLSVCIIGLSAHFGLKLLNSALDFTGIVSTEFEVQVEIPENATSKEVAEILADKGLISMPDLFCSYAENAGADGNFVAGTYTLSSAMSYSRLISVLQPTESSVRTTVEVRIVEGMTAREIAELLEEKYVCRAEDFMEFYKNKMDVYSFEKRVIENSMKFYQMEGYLYPDTYDFYVVNELAENPDYEPDSPEMEQELMDAAEIAAQKIYSNFNSKITKAMYKQMNEMGLTLNDLITLASMVQAEAGSVEDMSLVASVFMNRLKNPDLFPSLESDVTYFYVRDEIEPYYSTVKPASSLDAISDAYDTYTAEGIPAGPICNPGMDAIMAVLDYPQTDYFYFCANEETGETYFARTLAEHEQNLVLAGLAD